MPGYQGILVAAEIIEDKITTITRELLAMGRRLSNELKQPLSTLLVGSDVYELAKKAIALGSDRVYVVPAPSSAQSHPDLYVALLAQACQQLTPFIVLLGQTDIGRDVAPRLAARLKTSVCLDCVDLATEGGLLIQTRPVYGGNALAVWASSHHQPQVVTLRPRSVMAAAPDNSRQGEVIELKLAVAESVVKSKLLEAVKEETRDIKLEDARVIVSGGGGIGSKEGFSLLRELAQVLGGTIGTSRIPCDEGWMPSTLEIGQTGHIVSPHLYIAVGISGAVQHLAGCLGSKHIVAINKNADAPIFKVSDFGLVGDYREVLPALIERCKNLLAV